MVDYEKYIESLKSLFKNESKILGSELKKLLKMENSKNEWGSLISALIAKKILIKDTANFIKVKSKPVYYYKLSPLFIKDTEIIKSYLILDQFGTQHDYAEDSVLDEAVNTIIKDNPKLELTVYLKVKTLKAELKVITENFKN